MKWLGVLSPLRLLLPLWEKVDRRAAPRRMRGVGRSTALEHPSSAPSGHLLPQGEKGGRVAIRAIALATLLLGPTVSAHAENAVIARAIDSFVRPAYGEFHSATRELARNVQALCAAPAKAALATARDNFKNTVRAWSTVESIRFGPVTEANRLERILFWPDRKSIGLKQVQAVLAGQDATAADPKSLAQKSVAMQGLGALEFVLFGTGADDLADSAGAYRCGYGLAIATNLEAMASDVDRAWNAPDGIARQWANPAPGNPLYRNDDEALTELFNVFVHGLEMIRDVRFNGFLGKTSDDDKPRQAIFWRSGATVASLSSGLDGLAKLFAASDLGSLLGPENSWMPDSVRFEFANAKTAFKAVDGPIADDLKDAEKRKKLDYARIVTSSLSELFGVRLSGALGLTAGFSSLDGD
jgi:predicted lipoprotein